MVFADFVPPTVAGQRWLPTIFLLTASAVRQPDFRQCITSCLYISSVARALSSQNPLRRWSLYL